MNGSSCILCVLVLCIVVGHLRCNSDEKLSYHLSIFLFVIPWNPNIHSSFQTICDLCHYLNYLIISSTSHSNPLHHYMKLDLFSISSDAFL